MILVFRKFFIIALAMLQLVAPLVHAHTGDNSLNQGLHIPGLETYVTPYDAPVLVDVNQVRDSGGLLILVDAGIKNPLDISVISKELGIALIPSDQLFLNVLPKCDNNFSPQSRTILFRKYFSTHPSRAPPAQYL